MLCKLEFQAQHILVSVLSSTPRIINMPSEMIALDRGAVVALVIKSVKNPRSALCKTALMTSTDMFKAYQDQLLDLLDPLV
jgi:hypothetical protein